MPHMDGTLAATNLRDHTETASMPSRIALLLLTLAVTCSAQAGSFRAYHPDQHHFGLAMKAYEARRYEESREGFRRAARYADKPAQLALAIMARDGIGRAPDLAEAYAWADLASERGYSAFLLQRERIWDRLDAAQR
jgi:TPR repeat protein